MRIWLAFIMLGLGVVGAQAIMSSQQIIIFNGGSSASGSSATPCGTGVIDLSTGCSLPIALGLVP